MSLLEVAIRILDQTGELSSGSSFVFYKVTSPVAGTMAVTVVKIPKTILTFEECVQYAQRGLGLLDDVLSAVVLYNTGQVDEKGAVFRVVHQDIEDDTWCYHSGVMGSIKLEPGEEYVPVVYSEEDGIARQFPSLEVGSLFAAGPLIGRGVNRLLMESYIVARTLVEEGAHYGNKPK